MSLTSATKATSFKDQLSEFVKKAGSGLEKNQHVNLNTVSGTSLVCSVTEKTPQKSVRSNIIYHIVMHYFAFLLVTDLVENKKKITQALFLISLETYKRPKRV